MASLGVQYIPGIWLVETEKNHEDGQHNWSLGWGFNTGFLEYKSGLLKT